MEGVGLFYGHLVYYIYGYLVIFSRFGMFGQGTYVDSMYITLSTLSPWWRCLPRYIVVPNITGEYIG
jgi:hypothetical protein